MRWFAALVLFSVALWASTEVVEGQIVGPDAGGVRYFFFNNYTSVYMLHKLIPSIEFHPVLGGADNTYIRYQNWATFNLTSIYEVDINDNVVAQVNPEELTWTLGVTDTVLETGSRYTLGNLSTIAANGATISVLCETWSDGHQTLVGNLWNNVTGDQTEISFLVSNWPFQSLNNEFKTNLLFEIDGAVTPSLPVSTTPYQREVQLNSASTSFSAVMMTYGLLDSVLTKFSYSYSIESSTAVNFVLISKAFNNTFFYDPNFAVLLQTQPNCDSLGGCSHGTCVADNQCQCKKGYVLPDCGMSYCSTATQSSDDLAVHKDNNKISNGVIIGVTVGGFVLVVAVTTVAIVAQQSRTRERRKRLLTIMDTNKTPQA